MLIVDCCLTINKSMLYLNNISMKSIYNVISEFMSSIEIILSKVNSTNHNVFRHVDFFPHSHKLCVFKISNKIVIVQSQSNCCHLPIHFSRKKFLCSCNIKLAIATFCHWYNVCIQKQCTLFTFLSIIFFSSFIYLHFCISEHCLVEMSKF